MFSPLQILVRLFALVAATGVFAGLWANDQPVPTDDVIALQHLTVRIPLEPLAEELPVSTLQSSEEDWQTLPTESHSSESVTSLSMRPGDPFPDPIPPRTEIRAIHLDQLTISEAELQKHLRLLPETIPAGDYRVIDSFGGVGWLIVRPVDSSVETVAEDGVWTTTLDGITVRFIRAVPQPDRIVSVPGMTAPPHS